MKTNSLGSSVAPIFFMMMLFIVIAVIFSILGDNKKSDTGTNQHLVIIKFIGKDKPIRKGGEVYYTTEGDTLIVIPATDDDCRRILENHGKG